MNAWMAGIVDGEGCLTITRQIRKGRPSPAFRCSLTVANTDIRIMQPFSERWGGKLYKRPDARQSKQWADSYTWYCPHSKCADFLKAILPHLRAKADQATLILKFIDTKKAFARPRLGSGGKSALKGSAPLTAQEIEYRTNLWNAVRLLNAKGQYSRKQRLENA